MATQKKPGRPRGTPKTGGRKKGTPNKVTADVKEVAQQYGEEAIRSLVTIMRGEEYPPAARVAASKEILDRAYGKATQSVDHSSTDGSMTPSGLGHFYVSVHSTT
ncbi:MAG: hypothetical protein CL583_01765 [Alteromonadaceae bacterium]|nr:hypothetical protein [Alteromonadaceae bacterium]|tara:strand:+ start:3065 stop:3379 length:315 start_codon:yes stop_codon:yes gene_type:complete